MHKIFVPVALSALLAALPATLPGQVHSSSIQQNADGTTRMTFTVRAPAFSVGIVYGSTRTTNGVPLPPYGTLYLDPGAGLFNLFAIPIGPTGVGTLSLTLPTASLDGLMLATQAVIVTGSTVTLSNWSGIGLRLTPSDAPAAGAGGNYNKETKTLTIHAYGAVGAVVKVWEKEGTHVVLKAEGRIGQDGCWMGAPIPNVDLRAGDEILVDVGADEYSLKF
ncbi:MAG: hypothetical protein IPM13_18075 [Phycisphaerales bacterium]|nr:hypothetical protein [Phycisphaerales bacterium]